MTPIVVAIMLIAAALAGGLLGYAIGWDHGYSDAVDELDEDDD